jgi:hypothetical protein
MANKTEKPSKRPKAGQKKTGSPQKVVEGGTGGTKLPGDARTSKKKP